MEEVEEVKHDVEGHHLQEIWEDHSCLNQTSIMGENQVSLFKVLNITPNMRY